MNLILAILVISAPPVDKAAHFGVSFAATSIIHSSCVKLGGKKTSCLAGAIAGAAALGIAKELRDDHIDAGDLAADALGIGLSTLTIQWSF